MTKWNEATVERYLRRWQDTLKLKDWDIKYYAVNKDWHKTGDIKIDMDDKKAILLLNNYSPKQTNIEETIIHELLHLKLYAMDQMLEELLYSVFGEDENDKKFKFAYNQFMKVLEPTVEDLSKSFLSLNEENKELSFGRLQNEVDEELGSKSCFGEEK